MLNGYVSSLSSAAVGQVLLFSVACNDADTSAGKPMKPVTEERLMSFSDSLTRWWDSTFETPENIDEMLDSITLAMTGNFVDVRLGRKQYVGTDSRSDRVLYRSYVDLVVQPDRVVKGELQAPSQNVYVEHPWPNNLSIDELQGLAPVGVRVIVLADAVTDARENVRKLEEEGIVGPNTIPDNLVMVPAYGLVVEGVDGSAVLPLLHNQHLDELLADSGDALGTFDDALAAVTASED